MRLRSTRDRTRGGEEVALLEAADRGLAPDGGLWTPTALPRLDDPPEALGIDFRATAAWAMRHLVGASIEPEIRDRIVRSAFDFPLPVERLPEAMPADRLLDLTRGPTRAFKDLGARFLAALWALHPRGAPRTVLVATSGDTGGAVADACLGLPGLRAVVLYPEGRVSDIQRRQFTTLGGNVVAVSVDGPFDRCQDEVKAAFADPRLCDAHGLVSANSINPGRILPQLLPYLHLARIPGGPGTVIVPSGNLGNVWGALAAAAAGALVGRIVAACNRNDTLVRWLADRSTTAQPSVSTPSSAMDVGRPSNLERVERLLDEAPGARLEARAVDDETTLDWVRRAARAGRPVDPHTAVGLAVADRLRDEGAAGPITVVETASPAKFPEVLERAGVEPVRDPVLDDRLGRPEVVERLGVERPLAAILEALG